jgi:HCOMODA/2-hydroxy-3-carboxy-muconic semialdehyde decarboxylase
MKKSLLYTITVILSSVSAGAIAQTPPWQSASPKVRAAVDELVTANKILADKGIFASYGHISVRDPSDPNRLLISRSLAPDRVTAADIVELDLDCNPIGGTQVLLYQERFIHCAIYRARPDVNSVVHSHTPYMITFSVSSVPLRPVINAAQMMSSDPVPVYDTSSNKLAENNLVASPQSGRDLARTLGQGPVVLMRGHGSTVVASTVQKAVIAVIAMEQNAQILLDAKLLGGQITYLDPKNYGNERINRETGPEARDWNDLKAKALKQEGLGPR